MSTSLPLTPSSTAVRDILLFWGKARPASGAAGPSWHPMAYHSLDVAATVHAYLSANPLILAQLAKLWRLSEVHSLALACFLAAAHDVGKFGLPFQSKAPELFATLFPGQRAVSESGVFHSAAGVTTLLDWLAPRWLPEHEFGAAVDILEPLANATCGHHGVPEPLHAEPLEGISGRAAQQFLAQIDELFGGTATVRRGWPWLEQGTQLPSEADAFYANLKEASWLLAGVVTLCDWVGSSQQFFPYSTPTVPLAQYWVQTLVRAEYAIEACSLNEKLRASRADFAWLFGEDKLARHQSHPSGPGVGFAGQAFAPTPLQHYADTGELPPGGIPALFILEDETGSGKTEAALTLAARLMHAGKARGVFFGLPTQTTANSLFEQRIAPSAADFFGAGALPSLALSHGNADYAVSRMREKKDRPLEAGTIAADLDAWANDSAKTALLCDFGVGTVDQVALAGLPVRHVVLRHLGIARKVLVIDEAHACEPYLLAILQNTLTQHARMGGSAIILSATLPSQVRRELVQAFLVGAGARKAAVPDAAPEGAPPKLDAYPLATAAWVLGVDQGFVHSAPIAACKATRTLEFRPINEREESDLVREWIAEDKCVCLIRNTVTRAQKAYAHYHKRFPGQVLLVHARFAMAHRAANDEDLLTSFGKDSGPDTRSGRIVIATQVAEQSLDIDFDEMVSDLAPIDALLQRNGRRRRHVRDADGSRSTEEGRAPSGLYVIAPEVGNQEFMANLAAGTRVVYPMAGVLYRTAQLVRGAGPWPGSFMSIPDQVREAVEFVYDTAAVVPEFLSGYESAAQGKADGARQTARTKRLRLSAGYSVHAGIQCDERSVTRLGAPSVRLVLCASGGRPLFTDEVQSQVAVRQSLLGSLKTDIDGKARLRMTQVDGSRWQCELPGWKGRTISVSYERSTGLTVGA